METTSPSMVDGFTGTEGLSSVELTGGVQQLWFNRRSKAGTFETADCEAQGALSDENPLAKLPMHAMDLCRDIGGWTPHNSLNWLVLGLVAAVTFTGLTTYGLLLTQ